MESSSSSRGRSLDSLTGTSYLDRVGLLLVLVTAIAVPGHSSVRVVLVLDLNFSALHFETWLETSGVHALPSCSAYSPACSCLVEVTDTSARLHDGYRHGQCRQRHELNPVTPA